MKRERSSHPRTVHAVVPVNVLSKSKQRLAPILTQAQRRRLSVAMLKDVLAALIDAKLVSRVTVVSADRGARLIAKRSGAEFVWEGKRRGLNKGVRMAIRESEQNGASAVVVLHADLPLIKSQEVDMFLEESNGYSVAVTPSKDHSGTNALFLCPPRVMQPVFGKHSLKRHLLAARKRNLASKLLRFRGISFDIDKPRDLITLAHEPPHNETGQFLRTLRNP